MITGPLRSRIDKLWEEFWTGGITNPLTVIEQISFLMFARLLDMRESTEEKRWNRTNKGQPFPGYFFAATDQGQKIRWSNFRHLGGEAMLPLLRELSASVREAGAGVGVDWRSILHSKWRTTDAKWNKWSGRRPAAGS